MTVPFVSMSIPDQSVVKIVDIAGKEHDVTVMKSKAGFTARLTLADELDRSYASADDAVQRLLLTINSNHPKQFEHMERAKQIQLLNWIRLHLRKGQRGNTKRWSSNDLKDVVSQAIGFYVNNGELKGAMLAAGLVPTNECEYDTYWSFVLERNRYLWPFVWSLVRSQIGYANIDSHSSSFRSLRLRLASGYDKLWTEFIVGRSLATLRFTYSIIASPYADEESEPA